MDDSLKTILINNLVNLRGPRTKRKIVVIESDDWGSIRMPDRGTYNYLLSKGVRVDKCPLTRNDSLASEEDLSMLFEVLDSFRDKNGNSPVITANCVVANPDFQKIRENDFRFYHYEIITETFKKYPNHANSFKIWMDGIDRKIFFPQFHGREHLNVPKWMKALQLNMPETRLAFDNNLFGISSTITSEKRSSYLAAFDTGELNDFNEVFGILRDGLSLFDKILGYPTKSFIAPNYIWPHELEKELAVNDIRFIQGRRIQLDPRFQGAGYNRVAHYTGQKNEFGQIYTVRNCSFEPTIENKKDTVDSCLSEIRTAFMWGMPGIITSHRVNFIGAIDSTNRDRNLRLLDDLLSSITRLWPDVEYMTTADLGDLISENLR
ncbi:MAG: hypothetical protein IH591_10800 [Bacteroidales bacterium]|nr:hypothetical protein [Bacteroidales bacterium]